MLYSVYGIEGDKARAKKDSLVASCKKQRPDAEIFVLDNENFSENVFENLYSSQGLFSQKHVVVISKLLTPKKKKKDEEEVEEEDVDDGEEKKAFTVKDILIQAFPKMASSDSVFILFDELPDAKTITQIKKHAKDIFVFGDKKIAKGRDNSSFSVVDAFALKDRRTAWVNYQKCIRVGAAPEAIHGLLFWKMKTLLLAKKEGRMVNNFTEKELDDTLFELNRMYHRIRQEGGEMEMLLEKFILEGK